MFGRSIPVLALAIAALWLPVSAQETEPAGVGAPPGAVAYGQDLGRELARAVAARGADYQPRTRHVDEQGRAKFTNRLILESSPYLNQHAHNPVDWYPWGEEAFETARRLKRPILLSIGYSTCHWCHVMEEESFEDLEIAEYLNAHYIAIKVDREERPDLDSIYMSVVQSITGRGGWPMTTWLTPEGKPFYGGTYFPARAGDRGSRKGFLELLRELRELYDDDPQRIADVSSRIVERIRPAVSETADGIPGVVALENAAKSFRGIFDANHGGRGGAPKFPSSFHVRFLLREAKRSGERDLLEMAVRTLEKIADGGIHDHVSGGFHRYATDARWLVPHFEKMLYDNALLTLGYTEAFLATGRDDFAQVTRKTLDYVRREMTSPGGAFFSATDADSVTPGGEREEGWFFTWTPQELNAVLGEADARLVTARYGVTAAGNFEGRNILHVATALPEVAARFDLEPAVAARRLDASLELLYRARSRRPAPLLDDKILVAWNGLMISAFARAGFVLDEPDYLAAARRAADFVLEKMRVDGRLRRSHRAGISSRDAFLDDYAFLIAGLLDLFEATAESRWLASALELQGVLDAHYADEAGGGYFLTADDHESLLVRAKPQRDGAEPGGNSVALMNLVRLSEITTDDRFRACADALLKGFAQRLESAPASLPEMLMALSRRLSGGKEVVIVSARSGADDDGAEPFLAVFRKDFYPDDVVIAGSEATLRSFEKLAPIVKGKRPRRSRTTAYVCEQGVCQLPTSDVETFVEQLGDAPDRSKSVTHDGSEPRKKQ